MVTLCLEHSSFPALTFLIFRIHECQHIMMHYIYDAFVYDALHMRCFTTYTTMHLYTMLYICDAFTYTTMHYIYDTLHR